MLLGPARFRVDDRPSLEPLSSRRALLVGLLADAGPAGVPRERLGGLLWPNASEAQAHNASKQLVHKLRRQVGVSSMILAGTVLRLNTDIVTTDLWDVLEAARRRDHDTVLERHGGRFLDGAEAWDPPDLELWLNAQRSRAVRLLHEATERCAAAREGAGDVAGAVRAWAELHERIPADASVRARLETARARLDGQGGPASALAETPGVAANSTCKITKR